MDCDSDGAPDAEEGTGDSDSDGIPDAHQSGCAPLPCGGTENFPRIDYLNQNELLLTTESQLQNRDYVRLTNMVIQEYVAPYASYSSTRGDEVIERASRTPDGGLRGGQGGRGVGGVAPLPVVQQSVGLFHYQ